MSRLASLVAALTLVPGPAAPPSHPTISAQSPLPAQPPFDPYKRARMEAIPVDYFIPAKKRREDKKKNKGFVPKGRLR